MKTEESADESDSDSRIETGTAKRDGWVSGVRNPGGGTAKDSEIGWMLILNSKIEMNAPYARRIIFGESSFRHTR